ncbi:MAG: NIPSNAP family protein [Alphaproteobacteria bacterium]|nr:NIPSNAP family protein [Alphaproteobacteria bacterium]
MLHELRTYTIKPGSLQTILKANEEVGRTVRGDDYGKLEGYWYTDIGPLNQVVHLWSYKDMAERNKLRSQLADLEGWVKDYIPQIRPFILKQELRFMNPRRDFSYPDKNENFYEFRNYRLKPGTAGKWMDKFIGVMPTREKYSTNVCAWITESPDPNEVCHLWAYTDTNQRKKARDGVAGEAAWKEFGSWGSDLLEEMHSTLMWPANFSPLK